MSMGPSSSVPATDPEQWMDHPPRRKQYDPDEYMEKNSALLRTFLKMAAELPAEKVLTLFLPAEPSQSSASEPVAPSKRIQRRIKNRLPMGATSGRFVSREEYGNDVLAAMQFDHPVQMSKGIAVQMVRVLVRSGIRLGRCQLAECNRYFLDLSGVKKFCSRKHAQAEVNQRRKQKREAAIPKIIAAIAEYERRASRGGNWKAFVARHAHVTQHRVTLLVNKKVIAPPTR